MTGRPPITLVTYFFVNRLFNDRGSYDVTSDVSALLCQWRIVFHCGVSASIVFGAGSIRLERIVAYDVAAA